MGISLTKDSKVWYANVRKEKLPFIVHWEQIIFLVGKFDTYLADSDSRKIY